MEENTRLNNFVVTLNQVSRLNEAELDKNTFYIVNQYADLNPEEIDEHYAIQIKPYFKVSNTEAEYAGRQRNKEVNASELYDLDNAQELYKQYIKKYNKTNYKKKYNQQIHYYRFVKTLVELNNNYFKDSGNVTLDENADVIREPNEYFY
ncbi:unnamed protein product [Colias eurytheme]|nr:unnamed protein product [Colias eurytheme]